MQLHCSSGLLLEHRTVIVIGENFERKSLIGPHYVTNFVKQRTQVQEMAVNILLEKRRQFLEVEKRTSYHYYDTPEGQDIWRKMLCTSKYALVTGAIVSVHDILLYSHPKGIAQTLNRAAYFVFPLVGMAAAFTSMTYAATNLRGKDDKVNYLIGGAAAGAVFGAWQKSGPACVVGILALSAAALTKKISIEEGWQFFPTEVNRQYGSLRGSTHDYTITADRPKGWSTS